jgi:CPA1 family monovalent cation:H+ antiporter
MVKFLLEGLVFLLVGLQLRHVVADLSTPVGTVVTITAVVLVTVVVIRFAWVIPVTYAVRLIPSVRRNDPSPPIALPVVVSWAGMRGVVTLATALALPATLAGGVPYPRELFVWLAFAVIMGTLLLQGTTLPAVVRLLRVRGDDATHDTLVEAATQHAASRAARESLDRHAGDAPSEVVEQLRRLTERRANTVWERLGSGPETPSQAYVRLRQHMLRAERAVYREARDSGRIPEEVLVRAQRELDLEESMLERRLEE